MNSICVIPARGGSKRIPGKNVKEFCGKPIIAYSIEAAKVSQLFSHIIVSTDSAEIAKIAEEYGASVPFIRPKDIAGDYAGTAEVMLHAIESTQSRGVDFSYACCLYATAPMVQVSDLCKGYELLSTRQASTVFSVTEFSFPVERALAINSEGQVSMVWPEHMNTRSQDLRTKYHDAGQFYWLNVRKFVNDARLYSADSLPVILPCFRVVDIDTPSDWKRAEIAYKIMFLESSE